MKAFLGIDIGTTGCKSSIYSDDGKLLGKGYGKNEMIFPRLGWVEEDPEQWWETVCMAIHEACAQSQIKAEQLAGIAVSGAGALIAVDCKGRLLCSAIMQMDKRAISQLKWAQSQYADLVFAIGKNKIFDGVSLLQMFLWFLEERLEIYTKTHKFLLPNGYIAYRLTGKMTADCSRASTTLLLDIEKGRWSPEICRQTGISIDKMPEVFPSDMIIGYTTDYAAVQTGLSSGIPVAAGAMDTVAAGIGLGARSAGDAYLLLGTFGKLCLCLSGQRYDARFVNSSYASKDLYISFAPIDGGAGLSIEWLRGLLKVPIGESGADLLAYSVFENFAEKVSVGAHGLIYLPWLTGQRSPNWNALASSGFIGLRQEHTIAHFYRAIMEGIAYSARMNLEVMLAVFPELNSPVHISGGGSKSGLWRQIVADVLGRSLCFVPDADAEATGAASIAAKAVTGRWLPIDHGQEATIIHPGSDTSAYNKYYDAFCSLHQTLELSNFYKLREKANNQ